MRRLLLAGALLAATGCRTLDTSPFESMARNTPCADRRNRLHVIDERLVLWDRAGNCPDNGYAQTLYGASPNDVKCRVYDSIAGPQKDCTDQALAADFDTALDNLDEADLGLGRAHTVRRVDVR